MPLPTGYAMTPWPGPGPGRADLAGPGPPGAAGGSRRDSDSVESPADPAGVSESPPGPHNGHARARRQAAVATPGRDRDSFKLPGPSQALT